MITITVNFGAYGMDRFEAWQYGRIIATSNTRANLVTFFGLDA